MATTDQNLSPFKTTPVHVIDDTGSQAYGLMRTQVFADSTDELFLITQPLIGRLDLIATLYYSAPEAWWAIAQANNIVDPMTEVTLNRRIRVPTKERLISLNILTLT